MRTHLKKFACAGRSTPAACINDGCVYGDIATQALFVEATKLLHRCILTTKKTMDASIYMAKYRLSTMPQNVVGCAGCALHFFLRRPARKLHCVLCFPENQRGSACQRANKNRDISWDCTKVAKISSLQKKKWPHFCNPKKSCKINIEIRKQTPVFF